jgi:hypothetical protein
MSNILLLNQPFPNVGLVTMTYTIPTTGLYNVQVQLTEVPPTGLSVVINDNGTPIFTAPTITPTQIAQQFKFGFPATAAHVITVVLASSAAIDSQLQNVKSTVTIGQGL